MVRPALWQLLLLLLVLAMAAPATAGPQQQPIPGPTAFRAVNVTTSIEFIKGLNDSSVDEIRLSAPNIV